MSRTCVHTGYASLFKAQCNSANHEQIPAVQSNLLVMVAHHRAHVWCVMSSA
jgi:hypothetical protein